MDWLTGSDFMIADTQCRHWHWTKVNIIIYINFTYQLIILKLIWNNNYIILVYSRSRAELPYQAHRKTRS